MQNTKETTLDGDDYNYAVSDDDENYNMKGSLTPNVDLFKHKSIDIHYKKYDKSTIGAKNRLLFNNSSILQVEP